jgi:hypothetical protein
MLLLLIYLLLSEMNINWVNTHQFNAEREIFLLNNKNKSNEIIRTNLTSLVWFDMILIFSLIILFAIFVMCLYYQHLWFNYLFYLWSKIQLNSADNNEHLTILHRNSSSIYLTSSESTHQCH